jgi:hypothetical protein
MKQKLTFHPLVKETWGFSALQALAELKDPKGNRLGTLYLTYRNDPKMVPGKPVWVFKQPDVGGWLVENEESEESAKVEVIRCFSKRRTQHQNQ